MSAPQMSPNKPRIYPEDSHPEPNMNQPAAAGAPAVPPVQAQPAIKMRAANVNFYYGKFKALHDISIDIAVNKVTAMIGPSGCGKSTFLRNLNRINETLRDTRLEGEIMLDGENILDKDVTEIRRRIGM